MKNKLNRIIPSVLSAIITVTLLTACEKTESVAEETTVSETTAATIPADLTEEEMAIWESMPDIVTMRVYNDYVTETTEILYIDKQGTIKKVISDEYYTENRDIDWLYNKVITCETQIIDIASIQYLTELYSIFKVVDTQKALKSIHTFINQIHYDITYSYEIYFFNGNGGIDLVAYGRTANDYILDDDSGYDLRLKYAEIDDFIPANLL
ncbi:MAG: hypothetical protein IJ035_07750 [Oscillospiraceae bacterium]|nr:hypothetical protein [Oscillospiraceae bacterium]